MWDRDNWLMRGLRRSLAHWQAPARAVPGPGPGILPVSCHCHRQSRWQPASERAALPAAAAGPGPRRPGPIMAPRAGFATPHFGQQKTVLQQPDPPSAAASIPRLTLKRRMRLAQLRVTEIRVPVPLYPQARISTRAGCASPQCVAALAQLDVSAST
jgi:hypothetical protein